MLILRNYQESSKELLRQGFRDEHKRQVLCSSTGSGKSLIITSMIKSAYDKDSRVLFIAERRILVEQFSNHLDRYGIPHGILMAKHWRFQPEQKIQVASAQTLEKMESLPLFDIVFIDEVHCCLRKSVVNLIKMRPNMKVVGATATPFSPRLAEHFTNVVNVITMKELVDDGHLVPFRVFSAKEINTEGLKTAFDGEFERAGLETRARQITGDVVADYIRVSMQVYGELRKGIVFSSGIAHGSDLMQKFNDSGVNAVQISSEDSDDFKADVLAEFKKPDTDIKLVISSEILQRGFDQSDIDIVILAKAVKKSFSAFVQMIGRGARPHHEKSCCTLIDHGSNWLRFSEQWEELYHEGVKELTAEPDKKLKKEPTTKEKAEAKCPKCGRIGGGNPCVSCGYVRPIRNEVIAVPGEMLELTGSVAKKEKYDSATKERWYQELLGYAKQKGYKEGYAFWKYKDKFGIQPSWKKATATPSPEVLGWITHQNIKQSHSKKVA